MVLNVTLFAKLQNCNMKGENIHGNFSELFF